MYKRIIASIMVAVLLALMVNIPVQANSQAIGGNNAELLMNFLDTTKREYGIQTIRDAKVSGINYLRYCGLGWNASTISMYYNNQAQFWSGYDMMMNCANAYGVKLIPTFMWNLHQIPQYMGITDNQTVFIPNSTANNILKTLTGAVVNRYENNSAILFWEIANEINVIVDLEVGGYNDPNLCCNLTTAQMITFLADYATYIKSQDNTHLVSSGHSIPRPMAEHLRVGSWSYDNQTEFLKNIGDIHPNPIDIVSVHMYNIDTYGTGTRDNERFGYTGQNNAGLINLVKQKADSMSKILFVGEYGDVTPFIQGFRINSTTNLAAPFSCNVIDLCASLSIPYYAIWEWYAPVTDSTRSMYRIAPNNETTAIINKLLSK